MNPLPQWAWRGQLARAVLTFVIAFGFVAAASAQIAFRAATSAGLSSGTSLVITVPTGTVANDVLITTVAVRPSGTTVATPAGWTLANPPGKTTQSSGDTLTMSTYYRVAGASEPASYTWTLGGTAHTGAAGGMAGFSGVDTSTPIDVATSNAMGYSSSSVQANGVTTTTANTMLVTSHANTSVTNTWYAPLGMTKIVDAASLARPSNNGISMSMNYEARPSAGATNARSASWDTTGANDGFGVGHTLALKPRIITLSVTDASVTEGNSGTVTLYFTVTQSAATTSNTTFNYAISNGSATGGAACTAGVDYLSASGTGTIAAGSTSTNLAVTVCGDTVSEGDETFTVTLSSPVNAVLGTATATGTIFDDDPLADWRMDEAAWNGTAGEVKDSSGNGYHGRARIASGSTALPTTASVSPAYTAGSASTCNYGLFDTSSGTTRTYTYVELSGLPPLPTSFTFTAWIRSTNASAQHQRILVRDDADNGWGLSLADGTGQSKLRFFNRNITNNGAVTGQGSNPSCGVFCVDTNAVLTNNTWHFIAAAIDTSGKTVTLYVYDASGTLLAKASGAFSGTWQDGTGTAAIGGETAASSEGRQTSWHFLGNIDEVQIVRGALSQASVENMRTRTRNCSGLHHLEIDDSTGGAGLTCTPSTLTIRACANAACSSLYTGGLSGTLTASAGTANWGGGSAVFNIPAGSGSTTKTLQLGSVTTATIGISSPTTLPTNATTCTFPSPSNTCAYSAANAGLLFDVPDHVAEVSQTVNVSAVRASDNATVCVPAFQSISKNVTFKCSYTNPSSGYVPVRVGGTALNASSDASAVCDAGGKAISLSFNASGVASTTFQYADVGQLMLTATYTGSGSDAGLTMSGSDSFKTAPKDFAFSGLPSGPISAGSPFTATVTARNNNSATTRNFGRENSPESVTLSLGSRIAPSGSNDCTNGPCDGLVSGTVGSWSNGAASTSNATWSEVGQMTLKATLTSGDYLASGLTATGISPTLGDFVPAYFDTVVTRGCVAGAFTYSGQPFTVKVTAKNNAGTTTVNYSNLGACTVCSKLVSLYDPTATTHFGATNTLAASTFAKGEATRNTVTYTFPTALTAPATITLRAIDTSITPNVSSSGHTEGTNIIRSGRLWIGNAYGPVGKNLALPYQLQYWNGQAFVRNTDDSCTPLTTANIGLGNHQGGLTTTNMPAASIAVSATASGAGTITLTTANQAGSVDVVARLDTGTLKRCPSSATWIPNPAGTALSTPWLLYQWCDTGYDRDPVARATFGIFGDSAKKGPIYIRENF